MADTPDTPEHRTTVTIRSGDTHVIDGRGKLRNVDQEARAAGAKAKPAAKTRPVKAKAKAPRKPPVAPPAPAPAPGPAPAPSGNAAD